MLKQLPSGLVVQAKPEPPAKGRGSSLEAEEHVAVLLDLGDLISCLRGIQKAGGRLLSVTNTFNSRRVLGSGDRWIVIYEAKEKASWEQRC